MERKDKVNINNINGCYVDGDREYCVDLINTVLVFHKWVFSYVILKAAVRAKKYLGSENFSKVTCRQVRKKGQVCSELLPDSKLISVRRNTGWWILTWKDFSHSRMDS